MPNKLMKIVGDNIKSLRNSHQMTQEQLGDQVGVSKGSIVRWEQAKVWVPASGILALSEFFGVDPSLLFCEDLKPPYGRKPTDAEVLKTIADKFSYNIKIKKTK